MLRANWDLEGEGGLLLVFTGVCYARCHKSWQSIFYEDACLVADIKSVNRIGMVDNMAT